MTPVLPFVVALVVLLALAGFIWFWWVAPRSQVPPHLTRMELKRLEVEDRLRQTNYQILTALGLGATFLATIFQLMITSRQWSEDYELRTTQDRLGRYADALKALTDKSAPSNISGIHSLLNLALQDPEHYHSQVNEVLSSLVRQRATDDQVRESGECGNYDAGAQKVKYERSEALPEVQAAMNALGAPKFAMLGKRFSEGGCEVRTLRLDHRYLDELDLRDKDLSCADLSQSHFRRASFFHAILRGVNFAGARIADFDLPDFPKDDPDVRYMFDPGEKGLGWMLYRCRSTDFRGADLTNADFDGTALGGADFTGANLTGANFCGADVSRANFTKVVPHNKDELKKLLAGACVQKSMEMPPSPDPEAELAQPFGLDFAIPRCAMKRTCEGQPSEQMVQNDRKRL